MKKPLIIIIFLIPILLHSFYYTKKKDKVVDDIAIKENENIYEETITVNLLDNNKIINLSLDEYVIGVVACEMPASFETEALKAMSVAARTYALYKIESNNEYDVKNSVSDQCYNSEEDMKEKWNNDYNKYYEKIKTAVNNTNGEYITYNDKIIVAFYFSISNGYTESSENVFEEKLDYLKSVESSWDKEYNYKSETLTFTISEFLKSLGLKGTKIESLNVIDKSLTGRINKIEINKKVFKGTEVRTKLGLKSTDFTIKIDKNVVISTKGYGHGVGMSQYGAHLMAKNSKTYDEIIKYYYQNVEIKKV